MGKHIYRLEGDRVALSILKPDDETRTSLIQWFADSTTMAGNALHSSVTTYANIDDWIMDKSKTRLGIVFKETNELIGYCHAEYTAEYMTAEIGLTIGTADMRGKGIGSEVVQMLTRFCFEELRAMSIHMWVLTTNEPAISCYKKCGYTISGTWRSCCYHGKPMDWYFMDIIREEYDKLYAGSS